MDSLEVTDREAAKHAVAPRVTLESIEQAIGSTDWFVLAGATGNSDHAYTTICVVTMKNGFIVIGHSTPASQANFNAEFGKKLAYENCIRQLWPLMGFELRSQLAGV